MSRISSCSSMVTIHLLLQLEEAIETASTINDAVEAFLQSNKTRRACHWLSSGR
jgi:hypothetical protein